MVLQSGVEVTGGGPLAILVTALVAWLFYGVTLHLAATFFLGDVPSQYAARAAVIPVVVSLLLQRWGTAVVLPVTLAGDLLAIHWSYDLDWPATVALGALHLAFAAILGFALNNIFGFV